MYFYNILCLLIPEKTTFVSHHAPVLLSLIYIYPHIQIRAPFRFFFVIIYQTNVLFILWINSLLQNYYNYLPIVIPEEILRFPNKYACEYKTGCSTYNSYTVTFHPAPRKKVKTKSSCKSVLFTLLL